MNKCSGLTLMACVFALLTAERVAASPITWDFYVTSCTDTGGYGRGCDPTRQYPALLATLTLTGPDSSGSAVWDGTTPAVYTGDSFAFDFGIYRTISSGSTGSLNNMACIGAHDICGFDLSWSETGGQLDAVSVDVNGFHDTIGDGYVPGGGFGLSGGLVASDNSIVGCVQSQCTVPGYWTDTPLVTAAPEPGDLALLASAFGVWGLTGRRRVLHAV